MRELMIIMVCRHFAYGGTINKMVPFKQEIDGVLYIRFHGLLTPFRLPVNPFSDFYNPNCISTWEIEYRKIIGKF
jgi:hypothetical protein